MPACWKRWGLAAALALMLLAGGVPTAAAPAAGSPVPTLLDGVAKNLGVPAARLEEAVRAAELERWNTFAGAHHVPEARAKAIGDRIRNAPLTLVVRFGGPGRQGILAAAAGYLGVPREQLAQELRSGKSLAEVAAARGKSAQGMREAILTAAERDLAGRVQEGQITPAARDRLLGNLKQQIDQILQTRFRGAQRSLRAG